MIEVFITNIKEPVQAKALSTMLSTSFPPLKIDIDLWDSALPYPCGHTVLRVEGAVFESENIISTVQKSGFLCAVLEDKICPKKNIATEFWESIFVEKQEMWGFEPSKSAVLANDFFVEKSIQHVLIPGIGYGRNAQIFVDNGMSVTGIEISQTAIKMAEKHYGTEMNIYHGSVTDMPYDNRQYDGIFCYALIHLLDSGERAKLISDCYNQLADNGYMIFVAISKKAPTYGKGKFISKDRYEIFDGVKMYFYDRQSIMEAFNQAGLFEITEINENFPFFLIKCRKVDNPTKDRLHMS